MAFVSGDATTDGTTLLTVAAGTSASFSVTLAGALAVGIGGSAATVLPSVSLHGTNAIPADGAVLSRLALTAPAVNGASLVGVVSGSVVYAKDLYVEAPAGNSVTVRLNVPSGAVASATLTGTTT